VKRESKIHIERSQDLSTTESRDIEGNIMPETSSKAINQEKTRDSPF